MCRLSGGEKGANLIKCLQLGDDPILTVSGPEVAKHQVAWVPREVGRHIIMQL